MIWLLRDFDLLGELLRAASFSFEVMALGGLLFLFLVASPQASFVRERARSLRAVRLFALGLLGTQAAATVLSIAILHGDSGLPWRSFLSAGFVYAAAAEIFGCMCIALLSARTRGSDIVRGLGGCVVLAAAVAQSHSASRLSHRRPLMLLTALHHLGAAGWIGAMSALLLCLRNNGRHAEARTLAKRYSTLALVSVPVLVGAGVLMAWVFIGQWQGVLGSSYGILVVAKAYLTLAMLVLGWGNFRLLRGTQPGGQARSSLLHLRRFSEVEIGLGLTALLAAASLTAQPPAVDLASSIVSPHEVYARMRIEPPRLTSPQFSHLAPATSIQVAVQESEYSSGAVSDANDRAWSEYNHHWAGLIVLACGLLALARHWLPQGRWQSVAANWPLLFIGLAVFIVLRADPENWPLGPRPFWESFASPDVLEHRLYAVLITCFALFEWAVATGRLRAAWASYVFPLLCAAGGAALLTHSHGLANVKDETLAELSHGAIAVLGATAGWARWLEVRLPGSRGARYAAWVWPVCLALVGGFLLDYRES